MAQHFNQMMMRINQFNDELQLRVKEAVAELDQRYHEVQNLNEQLFDLQRRLSHAERLSISGRIVAQVAHEIGTPLHSVAGHLELLRKELPADLLTEEAVRRLGIIEIAARARERDHHPAPRSDPPVGRRSRTGRCGAPGARGGRAGPSRHVRRRPRLPGQPGDRAAARPRARRPASAGDPEPPDECDGRHAAPRTRRGGDAGRVRARGGGHRGSR